MTADIISLAEWRPAKPPKQPKTSAHEAEANAYVSAMLRLIARRMGIDISDIESRAAKPAAPLPDKPLTQSGRTPRRRPS